MMVGDFQDTLALWLAPWATYIWIFILSLTVITLNAYFIFNAMRTADNRMHLMLKILHQNLKYFRSFDNRLIQISATSRKSSASKENSILHRNAQLTSISAQLKQIEVMLVSNSNTLPQQIGSKARLLFPRINRHPNPSNTNSSITGIDRSQENYHSASPDRSRPISIPKTQPRIPNQSKTANSLSKENTSKLMAIFDASVDNYRDKDQNVG